MRKCDDCKIILEDGVRFCPKCGRTVAGGARATTAEMDSLLTSANLHRIRGQLDEAAAEASKAMQEDPNNPDAAALLAGIFEERGDLAEAAVWFKIASDLDPESAVQKAQLDRVGKAVGSGGRQGAGSKIALNAPVLWAIGVGLAVLVVASIVFFPRGGPAKPESRPTAQNRAPVQIVTPEATQARRSGSVPDQSTPRASQPATSSGSRTAAEVAIKASVSQAEAVSRASVTVDDVIADPRQRTATVTFSVPDGGILSKDKVLKAAEAISRAVFAANSDVQYVTARCVVPSGGAGGTQIGFVGDTSRQTIQNLPDRMTAEQLSSAFGNQWWNPRIR